MPRYVQLADTLRRWGLAVVEVDGWETRGTDDFRPAGGVAHHTAAVAGSGRDAPSLGVVVNGRPDLSGPLCNVLLGYSGTCYVIAAGTAHHAGPGGWKGLRGNRSVWGIEAENNGMGEPWPTVQLEAFTTCAAALSSIVNGPAELWAMHREWSTEGKIDPTGIGGPWYRAEVARKLAHGPTVGPTPGPTGEDDPMIVQFVREADKPAVYQTDLQLSYALHVEHGVKDRVWALQRRGVVIAGPPSDGTSEPLVDPETGKGTGVAVWVVAPGVLQDLLA